MCLGPKHQLRYRRIWITWSPRDCKTMRTYEQIAKEGRWRSAATCWLADLLGVREVLKISLFKAYCQSLYTCSLWVNYTQRAYSALRVQYSNVFRMLLGLPRYCSASGMLTEARVDGFAAIIRKRVASLLSRARGSPNSILKLLCNRADSPLLIHHTRVHTK